jgi:(2S)-methylsuccinyl-CoA dehydrogenase
MDISRDSRELRWLIRAPPRVHGGNGYALESAASRLLANARILNIFRGAAEIQANIIARGLLSGRN